MSSCESSLVVPSIDERTSELKKSREIIFGSNQQYRSIKKIFAKKKREQNIYSNIPDFTDQEIIDLKNSFNKWCDAGTYMSFESEKGELHNFLVAKRGNRVYEGLLQKRICKELSFVGDPRFKNMIVRNKPGFRTTSLSNVFFVTLTCDTKKYQNNKKVAWLSFEKDYNLFMIRLRQKIGDVWVLKIVESTKRGFPHIHLLMITKNSFDVFKPQNLTCNNCKKKFPVSFESYHVKCPYCESGMKHNFRMKQSSLIKRLWKSNVDILSPKNVNGVINYCLKDMFKQFKHRSAANRDSLSLVMGWIFGKQSYSISLSYATDLITDVSVIQNQIQQIKEDHPKQKLRYLGLLDVKFKNHTKPPPFSFIVKPDDKNYLACIRHIHERNPLRINPLKKKVKSSFVSYTSPLYSFEKKQEEKGPFIKSYNKVCKKIKKRNACESLLFQDKKITGIDNEKFDFKLNTPIKPFEKINLKVSDSDKNGKRIFNYFAAISKEKITLTTPDYLNLGLFGKC